MKKYFSLFLISLLAVSLFAQSDEDLFGGDDDLFTDDSLFEDDSIEEVNEVSAKTDLSKGVLFDDGSIKVGGNFTMGIDTLTTLYSEDEDSFGDNLKASKLTPSASAYLSVDARPSQVLRMYSKFGISYPYSVKASTTQTGVNPYTNTSTFSTSVTDWFNLKELFTDFSIADTVFFRFGLHTVTWGAGYFYSPVSDLINTSSINPEDVDAQVDGSLNLRTQIVFPNSQNCLWLYVIPSTNFTNSTTAESYVRDTALAGKYELVLGGWEFGIGGFWKYENAPKAMITATGSLRNVSLFGECVYRYGADSEWSENSDWDDKTSIFQATIGASRYWKNQNITLAAQYYYDGNNVDKLYSNDAYGISIPTVTAGHNIAAMANFGRIFGTTDVTATLFGMVNFGKDEYNELTKATIKSAGYSSYLNCMTLSAMMYYSPVSALKVGMGPYMTLFTFDNKPIVSLKLTATLGGGKF